jgi:hypothetical protein
MSYIKLSNGVTPSVGLVVTPERLESIGRMLDVLGCCMNRSSYPERRVLFHLFYRVYFASEKHVTRTSKTPYSLNPANMDEACSIPIWDPRFTV